MRTLPLSKIAMPAFVIAALTGCGSDPMTQAELAMSYPAAAGLTERAENPKIMCPFVRMLERSGLLDSELGTASTDSTVKAGTLTAAAETFGCASGSCGTIANIVGLPQGNFGQVDLHRLWDAGFLSHDCGLTFAKGATEITPEVRQQTLDRLRVLAGDSGRLNFSHLEQVKLEICEAQGVSATTAGMTEVKLIFAYLGGVDNGSIAYSDVERLLNATLPETKTTQWVDLGLINQVE